MVLWIHIEVIDFSVFVIIEFKQYKNTKIANFVYYEKTRMMLSEIWNQVIMITRQLPR